jgi:glycosyltransferase involved in cell wall biosynthesis
VEDLIANTIEHVIADGEARRELPRAVSVVIPAYQEAAHVAQQVRDVEEVLRTSGWTYEIIVVDDGSHDDTAQRAASTGARVLRRARNRGYGAALRLGIRSAQHDWILITDADGTYPVAFIPALLAASDRSEMVIGARTGKVVKIPLIRRPAKWALARLASYLAGERLPDINSGLRLMRRSVVERYEHLLPDGFSFTTTMTLACACNRHAVEYVSIDYLPRLGESKIRPRHAYDFLILILRTIVVFNPLKVFLPLGAVVALAGAIKLVIDVMQRNLSDGTVLAIVTALIIWSIGLLADQNSRLRSPR